MTSHQMGIAGERPLGNLGIGEAEEQLYRWLLAHPGVSAQEISEVLPFGLRKVQQLLNLLGTIGFVTHSPERPRRYIPVSPDMAVEALVRDRRDALDRALGAVPELREQASLGTEGHTQMVELITSRAAVRRIFETMSEAAKEEVIGLERLPVLVSHLNVEPEYDHALQREGMIRGVRFRTVVDTAFLESPGGLRSACADIRSGEEVRVVPYLPLKLMISDRHMAILPPNPGQPDNPSLLLRPSALLDALHFLFEILWERAAPISMTRSGEVEIGEHFSSLPETAIDLITLLSAGMNDKAIVYEMGVSRRTLLRRVSELMESLGARTRFQAGWLAALRASESDIEKAHPK